MRSEAFRLGGLSGPADLSNYMMLSQLVAFIDSVNQPKTVATLLGNGGCHIEIAKRRH
jgi:hypothetical protein